MNEKTQSTLKDDGWGEKITLGQDILGLGFCPTITVEALYQDFKKRLMDELTVGGKGYGPLWIHNDTPAILIDKEQT